MARSRQDINRRAAAARRLVLKRLANEKPKLYEQWMRQAYATLDAAEESELTG